jgi:hypothetical protein
MSKEVSTAKGGEVGLPNDWEAYLANQAKETAASVKPTSSVISLRSGIVSYQGVQVPDNRLNLVVIDFAVEHTLYLSAYDPDNITSPDCFALGRAGTDADMAPHEAVKEPQSEKCEDCPNFQWGSDPRGGRGKACQERYRLSCVPESALESGDALLAAEVALVKLPVTSGKLWSQYLQTVASLHARPEWGVITTLSAKPDPKTQFKAIFEVAGLVPFEDDPSLFTAMQKKRELAANILMKPYDPPSEEEEEEAPAPRTRSRSTKHRK